MNLLGITMGGLAVAPPTEVNTMALLHFDGANGSTAFPDEAGSTWTRNGTPTISTAQSVFGGASGLFNGTTDYLSTGWTSDFSILGPFTVEFRARRSGSGRDVFYCNYSTASAGILIDVGGSDELRFILGTGSFINCNSGATTVPVGSWVAIAAVSDGTDLYLFMDGVLVGTLAISGTLADSVVDIQIGRDNNDTSRDYAGYIDEFRFSDVARYTSNYTPAASEFPNPSFPPDGSPVLAIYNSATPTTDSTIPAPVLALIDDYLDITWTGIIEWANQSTSAVFTCWSLDDGDHRLYFDSGIDGPWKLVVNGGVVCTANPIITTEGTAQNSLAGQLVTIRAWRDVAANTCGIQLAVNGVYAYEQLNTAPGSPIPTPSTGYLNSISGGSPSTDVTQVAFQVNSRTASRLLSFNGAVLGDSTIASYTAGAGVPVASLLRSAEDSRNSNIASLAIGGATIDDQAGQWASFTEKADLQWVMIEVGLNDIDPAVSTATSIGLLQDLVDDVNASKPAGCKVYIATMTPCYQRMITRYGAGTPANNALAKWNAMNTAIMNGGGSPITGVDGRVNAHTIAMDDGVGNLDAAYDTGDGIHPNNAGRQVIANAWITQLHADGFL